MYTKHTQVVNNAKEAWDNDVPKWIRIYDANSSRLHPFARDTLSQIDGAWAFVHAMADYGYQVFRIGDSVVLSFPEEGGADAAGSH